MKITLEEYQLSELLKTAARLGANKLAVDLGLVKTKISKSEAYRRYSKWMVDRWIREGKIKQVKNGGKVLLDVQQLEELTATNDLIEKYA